MMPDPNCKRCGGTGTLCRDTKAMQGTSGPVMEVVRCDCVRAEMAGILATPDCRVCGGTGFEDDGHGKKTACSCTWATKAQQTERMTIEERIGEYQKQLLPESVRHQREVWQLEKRRAEARAHVAETNLRTAKELLDLVCSLGFIARRLAGDGER